MKKYIFLIIITICFFFQQCMKFDEKQWEGRILPKYGYTDHLSPPPQIWHEIYMKDAHSAESNEKSYFGFFPVSIFSVYYGWFYLQFTVTHRMYHRPKKKLFKSGQIHREDAHWSDNDLFSSWVSFVRIFFFQIWSILYRNSDFFHVRGGLHNFEQLFFGRWHTWCFTINWK